MSGIGRRSFAEQAARLGVLGILIAVLTFTAVVAPRQGDRELDAYLKQTVGGMSAGVRAIQGGADATHYGEPLRPIQAGRSQVPVTITIQPTWNAMPQTLADARSQMPAALRDVTGPGRYLGTAAPTAGVLAGGLSGFPVTQPVPGHPNGRQQLAVEGYPDLKADARLVEGAWPSAPTDPNGTIPVVITQASAKKLGWHVGRSQTIAAPPSGARRLVLTGIIAPRQTDSQFWQLSRTRPRVASFLDDDGNTHFATTVWADPRSWTAIAPGLGATDVSTWYPVEADRMSLMRLDDLQNALTTTLVNAVPIDDGTTDDHTLTLGSGLPQMLNLFDNTVASTRTVLTAATVAALGLGFLVLLATITLTLGARRPVRELLRTRGASARRLAGMAASDVAWWAVPSAVIGAAVAVLVAPSISGMPVVGARDILAAFVCAVAPIVVAAGAVLLEALPPRPATLLGQSRWVGEALLVLLAITAVIVTVTGGPDAATAVTGLAVGLAVAVVLLRGLPSVLRWATALVRRGGVAVFVGLHLIEGSSTAGAGWLVVASVTAAVTGVLVLQLGMSAARAQQQTTVPGPMLLAPGALAVVAVAVVLCVVFAAAAFAVSVVAARGPRRARAHALRRLGYSGGQSARVSLWGTIPLTVVAVAIGALVGAWIARPVLGAVAAASGQAVAVVVAPGAAAAVAGGILVLILVIEAAALTADARSLRRSS